MFRLLLASALILPGGALAAQSLVITNKQDATASIISLGEGKTVATLPTTNPESDEIWLIDAVTRAVRMRVNVQSPTGGNRRPFGIVVAPAGDRAWVTMSASAEVAEIDLATGAVARWMATGQVPDGIGYAR